MADILENPVDLIDDAYEQEIQVEQEMIEVVAYRSYNRLDDKPQINGVELVGNKTSSDLGITAQIESAVNSEAQARAQADNTLQGKIDTEKLARQQADSTLQGNIDAEETALKAADKDIQDVLDGETLARQNADTALGGRIDTEIHDRQVADIALQGQIDAITSKSDVVDVVANYVALQAYDTSSLGNNDVIKVLDDETHEDALTYYRWSKTNQTWTFIGQEAPYYSKSQTDTLLLGKQNTIDSSHKLSADLVDDTSTTNKFVTASDITNWNGKQDALTAGTGIDITGGVISTPAIVPEVVAELPTTGEEGKLYLTPKAHTTQTATGNPISVNITDNAGKIESLKLDGDTYQQTYTGKNCIGFPDQEERTVNGLTYSVKDGIVTVNGTATSTTYTDSSTLFNFKEAGDITLSIEILGGTQSSSIIGFQNRNRQTAQLRWQQVSSYTGPNNTKAIDAQTVSDTADIRLYINSGSVFNNFKFRLMAEYGSISTSFEPFVGGTPSPNPTFPQPIQTVTGEQTISINGTNYPISLGSLELCKLDTYQDYIWKDGESWKVHKAMDKHIFNGSESFTLDDTYEGIHQFRWSDTSVIRTADQNTTFVLSDRFRGVAFSASWTKDYTVAVMANRDNPLRFMTSLSSTAEAFKTWLASNQTTTYFVLKTPTDMVITDQTLIAQLEAVRTAALSTGSNTISNTATGTNLAGDLEIGYYGYDPRNRYDKWLWLDINNNYEQIGS